MPGPLGMIDVRLVASKMKTLQTSLKLYIANQYIRDLVPGRAVSIMTITSSLHSQVCVSGCFSYDISQHYVDVDMRLSSSAYCSLHCDKIDNCQSTTSSCLVQYVTCQIVAVPVNDNNDHDPRGCVGRSHAFPYLCQ
jgi:hypothetical protein